MASRVLKSKRPHVLAVPYPTQGHVKPLMKLCQKIAKQGIKVTFVSIQSIHEKILAASRTTEEIANENLVLTSIPNGRGLGDEGNDTFHQLESLKETMPKHLTGLMERINGSDENETISCVIADVTIGWIKETIEKSGVEYVGFSPPGAATLALMRNISKLVEEGMLDSNGNVTKGERITLSGKLPAWKNNGLTWSVPTDLNIQKIFFNDILLNLEKPINQATLVLGNTFSELEQVACDLNPNLLPIGPLVETNNTTLHLEDGSCTSWLDEKSPRSVVYVSFGSHAVFSQVQLDELVLGLELSGHAFLWVVRSDLANGSRVMYPHGFLDRMKISGQGKIVEWAPQEEVLSHSSTACFISHCGWNSTLEGVSKGVPFLCWPYFSDQYYSESYICDVWKIGLTIDPDESGIRSRYEIEEKIDKLISDGILKKNALELKEVALKSVTKGGSSYCNFQTFIDHLTK